jgi:hypothetical protein
MPVEYEITVWIGGNSPSRSVNWFDPKTESQRALEWFKESFREATEEEDGTAIPYFTVYKYLNDEETRLEFSDCGTIGLYDGSFTDLPKYIQKMIQPLVDFQSTIEYPIGDDWVELD